MPRKTPPARIVDPSTLKTLSSRFFQPSAVVVAKRLLGHYLLRRSPEGLCGGRIVETEAYLVDDPACHGFRGKTLRNCSIFGPPGRCYVYFIYGNHYCVNAVCRPAECGEAVLVRAIEVDFGESAIRQRRPGRSRHELTAGPGRLCAALSIDRQLDGVDLCDPQSPLIIARNPNQSQCWREIGPVVTTTRVGLSQATDAPLRFYLERSEAVSRRPARARKIPAAR